MSTLIESLQWRYATKKFNAAKKVSSADLQILKETTNLAASSFGLQPFRIAVVDDQATKDRLSEAAYNQTQPAEASHVFVFAAKLEMTAEYIENFIRLTAKTRDISYDSIEGYGNYIKSNVVGKPEDFIINWNKRQAYIALGTLLAAAAENRIDACPMEGFDSAKVDEILGLKEKGLTSCVMAPVGYRSEEDHAQHYAKVRYPLGEMFL